MDGTIYYPKLKNYEYTITSAYPASIPVHNWSQFIVGGFAQGLGSFIEHILVGDNAVNITQIGFLNLTVNNNNLIISSTVDSGSNITVIEMNTI